MPGVLISAKNYNSLRRMIEKKNDDAQGEKVVSALVQRPKGKKDSYKKKKKKKTHTHILLVILYKYVNSNIRNFFLSFFIDLFL